MMIDHLDELEGSRRQLSSQTSAERKAQLGQFFTSAHVARFMASLPEYPGPKLSILDPGAGLGTLFASAVFEICKKTRRPQEIHITAYENDSELRSHLDETVRLCARACDIQGIRFSSCVRAEDFVDSAVNFLSGTMFAREIAAPNIVIMNPPYRKIRTGSAHSRLLKSAGLGSTNLYTAFLALAMRLLQPGGELVSITPRSFCSGLYFRPFRNSFLDTMSLRQLHVLESRVDAFSDDDVLQENIILYAVKSEQSPKQVLITSSSGAADDAHSVHRVPYELVVHPGDEQRYIHIVTDAIGAAIGSRMSSFTTSLDDLGVTVSTGRVVEFRATKYLCTPTDGQYAPLIYPANIGLGEMTWPKPDTRKPQAIVITEGTRELLVPNENYVLVKRFSAKEERKRIVASVCDASTLPGPVIGIENHLNYFHSNNHGLDMTFARGMAGYLNSTLVDTYFRQFSGHTQVNATDLRNMTYPSYKDIERLGLSLPDGPIAQEALDTLIEKELLAMPRKGMDALAVMKRVQEAKDIIKSLGLPRAQQNDRSALALLALVDLKPADPWPAASAPLRGITPMMDFFAKHYGKKYAPNSRETVRRQTVHQFLAAGLVLANPDEIYRPVNSGKTVYKIEPSVLALLQTYGSPKWEPMLEAYRASAPSLSKRYGEERDAMRISINVANEEIVTLSPGGQNVLVEAVWTEFKPRFLPNSVLVYLGDADQKFTVFDKDLLRRLGVVLDSHGKIPDVILYDELHNWLVLIEAVTSHGPVSQKRRDELKFLFKDSSAGLVFVTAFMSRKALKTYFGDIAWGTEAWVSEAPDHLIHFNGDRFLGPHDG